MTDGIIQKTLRQFNDSLVYDKRIESYVIHLLEQELIAEIEKTFPYLKQPFWNEIAIHNKRIVKKLIGDNKK